MKRKVQKTPSRLKKAIANAWLMTRANREDALLRDTESSDTASVLVTALSFLTSGMSDPRRPRYAGVRSDWIAVLKLSMY